MGSAQATCVVVVGGGVIGLSTSLELAVRGYEVVLVDPAPGRGASWAAGGMLSAAAEVAPGEAPLLADLRDAAARWPAFAERVESLGRCSVDFAPTGSVLVGVTRSDAREVDRLARQILDASLPALLLEPGALAGLEPSLGALSPPAWLLREDHHVDNRLLVDGLLGAVKSLGVAIVEDRCLAIDLAGPGVRCALEHRGVVDADRCVLATGAAPPPPATIPLGLPRVRPVRGCTLRLRARAAEALPTRTVRAIVDGLHCYLVPRGDRSLVVGATSEEDADATVARAGGVYQLLDAARRVLPVLDELHLEDVAVGLRPATDDHLPVVGPLGDPRVVAALGHYRNGVLLAPLAAARAADAVEGRCTSC